MGFAHREKVRIWEDTELGWTRSDRNGLVLMVKVTEEHPEFSSQWKHSELHKGMAEAGTGISVSQIGRILAADEVRPTGSTAG